MATTNLTVHRNTLAKRRRKETQAHMLRAAKEAGTQDVRAWALVTIRANGSVWSEWDTGAIMPLRAFPAAIQEFLNQDIAESGMEDDWRPNLAEIPGDKE